jgi:predicted RNA binding protein YcfA (HicA-like mRNA interferase family)
MPKLPVLSGADVVKMLERLGFEQIRQRGSHVVMRRGSVGTVVPLHKELKSKTLAGIIRQAGLTQDEFLGTAKQ